ncbi:hypothetical protein J437_LFUL000739 [Ladona fulva]|uniref:Receptor ligand binding region domain-containing protein n=1 Tax=Ladona fulva TaxID=123851 RepID=A0A8K0JTG7_LADFU|nr:hypothetical protein J437_LFUL000739 [Ladona fulva]
MFTQQAFPNFFRVVPSETAFNAPRLALLRAYNWTRVGTLYQNEPRYSLVSIIDLKLLKSLGCGELTLIVSAGQSSLSLTESSTSQ